ncbi:class I SAM-dependent methyltransferase [Patescibacteria group bacterium]
MAIEAYVSGGGAFFPRTFKNILEDFDITPTFGLKSLCIEHQKTRSGIYFGIYSEMLRLFRGTGFQPGQKLYEFGVGPGVLASRFEDSGLKVIGTDVKDLRDVTFPNLAVARSHLPFPDGAFDYVSATSVFHHIPLEEHSSYLAELRRILNPNGVILIQEDERGRNAKEQFAIRAFDRMVSGPEANSHRRKCEWVDFFHSNRLIIESTREICHKIGPLRLNKIFFALTLN